LTRDDFIYHEQPDFDTTNLDRSSYTNCYIKREPSDINTATMASDLGNDIVVINYNGEILPYMGFEIVSGFDVNFWLVADNKAAKIRMFFCGEIASETHTITRGWYDVTIGEGETKDDIIYTFVPSDMLDFFAYRSFDFSQQYDSEPISNEAIAGLFSSVPASEKISAGVATFSDGAWLQAPFAQKGDFPAILPMYSAKDLAGEAPEGAVVCVKNSGVIWNKQLPLDDAELLNSGITYTAGFWRHPDLSVLQMPDNSYESLYATCLKGNEIYKSYTSCKIQYGLLKSIPLPSNFSGKWSDDTAIGLTFLMGDRWFVYITEMAGDHVSPPTKQGESSVYGIPLLQWREVTFNRSGEYPPDFDEIGGFNGSSTDTINALISKNPARTFLHRGVACFVDGVWMQ
jgi:hypothetical protein